MTEQLFESTYWVAFGTAAFLATVKGADLWMGLRDQRRHAPKLRFASRLGVSTAAVMLLGMMPAKPAFSADNENTTTTDSTKNPLTGSETTTKKHVVRRKHANGKTSEKKVEEKTTMKKDGAVEQNTTTTETPAK